MLTVTYVKIISGFCVRFHAVGLKKFNTGIAFPRIAATFTFSVVIVKVSVVHI